MRVEIFHEDCLKQLENLPENTIDSCVTDPPSGISLHSLAWDTYATGPSDAPSHIAARKAFAGFITEVFVRVFRVLKPGAYGLVWALPRTSAWTATGLEDAGFEIKDVITHIFSTGFPKKPTVLKPASEHWILIKKPFKGTIERNTEQYGVGSLQIDAARVGETPGARGRWPANLAFSHKPGCLRQGTKRIQGQKTTSRPPDKASDAGWGHKRQGGLVQHASDAEGMETVSVWDCVSDCPIKALNAQEAESSRFFPQFEADPFLYQPKVTQEEKHSGTGSLYWKRTDAGYQAIDFAEWAELQKTQPALCAQGNIHATPKSVNLMSWLVKLVTPPGGKVLDCFMGSGTTGVACVLGGFEFIGIEKEAEYFKIAEARLNHARIQQETHRKLLAAQANLVSETAPTLATESSVTSPSKLTPERLSQLVRKATRARRRDT